MLELRKKKNIKWNFSPTDSAALFSRIAYINEMVLYPILFKKLPIVIEEENIDCKQASNIFSSTYADQITDSYYNKIQHSGNKHSEIDDLIYVLKEDILVKFDTQQSTVRFLFKGVDIKIIEKMVDMVRAHKENKKLSRINLIVHSKFGFDTKSLTLNSTKIKIEDNYNDDFKLVHQIIEKRLKKENDKGIVLLHGKPGTGKTSYIRYLASTITKNIIFLPPNLASAITNPELITLLIDNPNSIFVIEDAEQIISARKTNENSPVSALLNLADGLLSDCLNIQIICSFNIDISKVDEALLRKGRLIAKYEFNELATHKANALSNKLGFTTNYKKAATLTDIYNQSERVFKEVERKRIGF